MKPISYKHHRFPPAVIRHTVWLYFRFTLSLSHSRYRRSWCAPIIADLEAGHRDDPG